MRVVAVLQAADWLPWEQQRQPRTGGSITAGRSMSLMWGGGAILIPVVASPWGWWQCCKPHTGAGIAESLTHMLAASFASCACSRLVCAHARSCGHIHVCACACKALAPLSLPLGHQPRKFGDPWSRSFKNVYVQFEIQWQRLRRLCEERPKAFSSWGSDYSHIFSNQSLPTKKLSHQSDKYMMKNHQIQQLSLMEVCKLQHVYDDFITIHLLLHHFPLTLISSPRDPRLCPSCTKYLVFWYYYYFFLLLLLLPNKRTEQKVAASKEATIAIEITWQGLY